MNKYFKPITILSILAIVLAIAPVVGVSAEGKLDASAGIESIPPTVDGRFYGDGEDGVYYFLAENPGRGQLYYYLDGSILHVAMIVDPSVNDNVFGDMGEADDRSYVQDVGWRGQANQHTAQALIASEHFEFRLSCGTSSWTWTQDLAYQDANGDRLSDTAGNDGSGAGTEPPGFISSASSTQWNFQYSSWDAPAEGDAGDTRGDTWKSPYLPATPDSIAGVGYSTFDPVTLWEWPIVYEFATDLSASCGTAPFTIEVVSAHNSPPTEGDPDIPVDPVDMLDFGDAPYDPASPFNDDYPTLLAQDGARHYIIPGGPYLGASVDAETDGQPDGTAAGDDAGLDLIYPDNNDDEDGITNWNFPSRNEVCFDVTMGPVAGYVDGWIDWDRDGVWDADEYLDLGGRSFAANEVRTVCVTPNPDRMETVTYARFRVSSSTTALGPAGLASDGEVEDYMLDLNPLLIDLASFSAKAADGAILFEWETASEINNVGFNLYRAESLTGVRIQLNDALIPSAVAPGSLFGASYSLLDESVEANTMYYYWLEDVDINGLTTLHGPVQAATSLLTVESPIRRIGR